MNASNDTTQEFLSPYAGHVSFLFTDTSCGELEGSMRSLGALPKLGRWLYPDGAQPLLECTIIEDVEDYAERKHLRISNSGKEQKTWRMETLMI